MSAEGTGPSGQMPLSLYIHIPFCQRKCPYCDFNTYAGLGDLFGSFSAALQTEIRSAGIAHGRPPVHTVFVGGGTPTVLPPDMLAAILQSCRDAFAVEEQAEISCEANPGTVDAERFVALRRLGVNRLSLGVQSFDDEELRFLGRIHAASEAEIALKKARTAGFNNINLDLMYGLPQQPAARWRATLQRAIDLRPEHLSLYALTIEEDTPFASWSAAGRFPLPDPDRAADHYELADALLASSGYVQYEISNWARKDGNLAAGGIGVAAAASPTTPPLRQSPSSRNPPLACRHNLTYWRNEAYLGLGPGAHSAMTGHRWANVRAVPAYIDRLARPGSLSPSEQGRTAPGPWSAAVDWVEEIDDALSMGETMLLGLRLTREGVSFDRFEQRHGRGLPAVFGSQVEELAKLGLLEQLPDRIRLSPQARLVANHVFARFLP